MIKAIMERIKYNFDGAHQPLLFGLKKLGILYIYIEILRS